MKKYWMILAAGVGFMVYSPLPSDAAQYFAPRYQVAANGQLQPSLQMNFSSGNIQPVSASLSAGEDGKKILALGWPEGDRVQMCIFAKGTEYALYKLNLREGREDLLVLSYGKRGPGKTRLEDAAVIGEDGAGKIRQLSISGFIPVLVFNSPLQIRQEEAVLFLDQAPRVLAFQPDGTDGYKVSEQ